MRPIALTLRKTSARWLFCAAALSLVAIPLMECHATPLDKNACAKVAQDMQNLKALDVDKLMVNGPAWAASHLSPSDMGLVRQYIDLDEQMKFRCSAPGSLVHLKHLEDDDDENGAKPSAEAADGAAASKAQGTADKAEAAPSPSPTQKPIRAAKKPKQPAQGSAGDGR